MYQIGDLVEVSFKGKVSEMKQVGDKIRYTIEGDGSWAIVREDVLFPVELPRKEANDFGY